jgi:glycerol uptake facilitator-like aquaporin
MIKKLITEFLGTFLLVFVYLTTHNYLATGTAYALAMFLFRGAYNPAVALALLMAKEISTKDLVVCLIAEFAAVIAAFFVSRKVFSTTRI